MRKKVVVFSVFVSFLTLICASATDTVNYKGYLTNTGIYYNGQEQIFSQPVVTIDGYTYIPFREACEKANIEIEWYSQKNEIVLKNNLVNKKRLSEIEVKALFSVLFGFDLPASAKVSDYDLWCMSEPVLTAKMSITKSDIMNIKSQESGKIQFVKMNDFPDNQIRIYNKDKINSDLKKLSNEYKWWDLTEVDENVMMYSSTGKGIRLREVYFDVYIKENPNGECWLYAHYTG